jgi:putative pyruvate formate lyase activating enzyme
MPGFESAYLTLLFNGELGRRVDEAHSLLANCTLCARECGKNRLTGELGVCRTGERARVASFGPHHGEEYPLSGWRGSGTIFFSRCNLSCQYCQNHDISQTEAGREIEPSTLAEIMLGLQEAGCHNINFVSPSHVVAQILAGIMIAAGNGLRLPLVYNTGGYDSMVALRLLDGVIDIYMPDMKYNDPRVALLYSKARDYPSVNRAAVKEMHRQVGDLQLDQDGLARHGLLVRHLILPNRLAGTRAILRFLAKEISTETYLNLMNQYHPAYRADQFPAINQPVKSSEFQGAVRMAREFHLHRLDKPGPLTLL